MGDEIAREVMQRQSEMAVMRGNFENHWQETAEVVAPEYARFTAKTTEGQRLHDRVFDNTAYKCLNIYMSVLNTMLTPRNRIWHHLRAKDDNLKDDVQISRWLEHATKRLFSMRYSPYSNFASQVDSIYFLDGLVGNACLYVDHEPGKGLRYRSIFPGEIYIDVNHQGLVNRIHRKFGLKGRQAQLQFKDLPSQMTSASGLDREFMFIHCVKENPEYNPNSLSPDQMRYVSYYVAEDGEMTVSKGGYRTMPYVYSRHSVAPFEHYGRGPAMRMLPTIKMMNEKQRTIIRSAQMSLSPPLMLGELGHVQPFSMRPASMNYGYLLQDGREMVKALQTGNRPDIGIEILEMDKKTLEQEFFVNLYNILIETPEMTATEVMQRVREKAELLTPTMGRKQSEFLGVLLEREIDIMSTSYGLLDDMPEALSDVDFEYDTQMTRNMQAEEGTGILRTLETAIQASQVDPSVMDIFNIPELMRELSKINGVPYKVLRTREEVMKKQEEDQKMQQAMAMSEMAKNAAPAAKAASDQGVTLQ